MEVVASCGGALLLSRFAAFVPCRQALPDGVVMDATKTLADLDGSCMDRGDTRPDFRDRVLNRVSGSFDHKICTNLI